MNLGDASTGVPFADRTFAWAVGIAAVIGVLSVVTVAMRRLGRITKVAEQFRDDWLGTEARPGVPARAGVMVRLAGAEAAWQSLIGRIEGLERLVGRLVVDGDGQVTVQASESALLPGW